MPTVTFETDDYRWDGDRFAIAFGADVDGKHVVCLISGEALVDHFGAREKREGMLQAFLRNRNSIEKKARDLIDRGSFEGGRVLIRRQDFQLQVADR